MILTVDASVALKWFFQDRDEEADVDAALDILRATADGSVKLIQPPHFMAEMTAVLAREAPATASASIEDFCALGFAVCDADLLYRQADQTYFKKAKSFGRIELLSTFNKLETK